MSSIPAAKERLTEAEFDDAAWPAALERLRHTEPGTDDQGIAIVGTRDLEMALIRLRQFADVALGNAVELSRLEQENAKLRAERDEALEALKPFAAVSEKAKGSDDACWCGQDGAVIRYRDLRRAASLINKGGADV